MKHLAKAAAIFWSWCILSAAAQFIPAATIVRDVDSFHLRKNGEFTQIIETALRVETQQGVKRHGERKLYYNSKLETLEILEAYTQQPDGTRVDVDADKIRTQDGDGSAIFSDDKVRVIIYPKVEIGSLLVLKAQSVQITPVFPGHFTWSRYFNPHHHYESATIILTHEPGIRLQFDADRVQGGRLPAQPGDAPGMGRYRFTYRQMQAHPGETGRVALSDFAPHIALSSFADYGAFAQAYHARAKPMAAVTPAIAKLAQALTAGATDERDKVRRLYNWVSRNIRYVAVYAGAGGWIPHEAASVLENRYGDCKDHVTLLEALLHAVGVHSTTAMINSGDAYALPKLPIDEPFNHVITYVPSLDLYLDSTAQFAPMGMLPEGDMDKPVLLADSGKIGRTPPSHPEGDFTHTQIALRLLDNGQVSGTSTARMGGYLQVNSRASQFAYQNREQADTVNDLLARFLESGSGEITTSDPLDLDAPWQVQAVFELDPMANVPGPSAMTIPIGLAPGKLKSAAKYKSPTVRRFPLECASERHRESITLQFPPTVQVQRIADNVQFTRGPLSYTASYAMQGDVLRIEREYTARRDKSVCDGQDDADWTALREVLQRDLRAQVFFK